MADEVNVDFAQMHKCRDGVTTAYGTAQGTSQSFHPGMAQIAQGQPWGTNNGVSQAIGMCYTAVSAIFVDCHQQNLQAYAAHPQRLDQMIKVGHATEQVNSDSVNSVRAD